MNWTKPPAMENQPGSGDRPLEEIPGFSALPELNQPGGPEKESKTGGEIQVGKSLTLYDSGGKSLQIEIFTVTLGGETIDLVPLKNWTQLDHYKWTARGKLPGEPAGLEVALDQVRIAGQTVTISDPGACSKLEHLLNEWLALEKETLELARKKAQAPAVAAAAQPQAPPKSEAMRFEVEVDRRGQVHVHCAQGKNRVASIGLTVAGFNSLCQQGLMRKPRQLEVGALHDWVELDGRLCSFENGRNDAALLEQLLNEGYMPLAGLGAGKQVRILVNAASSSGFDIEFPLTVGGMCNNHRQHLNEEALELLQDVHRCGLLRNNILVKLIPPNLVFKQRTSDGGEQYLNPTSANVVRVTDDLGQAKNLDLSQPLNLLRLSAAELTSVFNHPAINQHSGAEATPTSAEALVSDPMSGSTGASAKVSEPLHPAAVAAPAKVEPSLHPARAEAVRPVPDSPNQGSMDAVRPTPNLWLKTVLSQAPLRQDWFASLVYSKMAERFGNSASGNFGPAACWFISLGEEERIESADFKGIVLTEKGSLGFINRGQIARFYNHIAFIGSQEEALEGIEVQLVAIGLDAQERVVFIVSDDYRGKFGVPETALQLAIDRLREAGAMVMSLTEGLASPEPFEVVWTVPEAQADPNNLEALENVRPS